MMNMSPREIVMWSAWAVTGIACLGTIGLVVAVAVSFTWPLLVSAIFLALVAIGLLVFANVTMRHVDLLKSPSVFSNNAEQEVLSTKQRKVLKAARGEVIMELAMLDVEKEKENIAHRRMTDLDDTSTPPHRTSFTNPDGSPRQINRKSDYR